jgi:hypothetical protein
MCHMPCPSHSPSCDWPNIWQGLQIIRLLIMQFYSSSYYFLHPQPSWVYTC